MSEPGDVGRPREARAYQGESAGLVTRLVANTIDALVVALALGACYLGLAAVAFFLDPRTFTFPTAGLLLSVTAAMSLSTAYLTLAWWLTGKTYGNHIMGLRVVGRHGRRLGPLRSLARAAFCVFFPIGLFWCVISAERRSVQDAVLWTRVVYDWLPVDHDHTHGHGHDPAQGNTDGHGPRPRARPRNRAHPAAPAPAPPLAPAPTLAPTP